jgi:hypothetical protein
VSAVCCLLSGVYYIMLFGIHALPAKKYTDLIPVFSVFSDFSDDPVISVSGKTGPDAYSKYFQ